MALAAATRNVCQDDDAAASHQTTTASRLQNSSNITFTHIASDRGEDRFSLGCPNYTPLTELRSKQTEAAFALQSSNHQPKLSYAAVVRHSMAETPLSPTKQQQESATTREEMDFDDDAPEQETGTVSPLGHETPSKPSASPSGRKSVSFQEPEENVPPAKPPRPMSPQQQAENTLIEAFPSIDTKVVKAVLMASGGKVEPAFNALLGMSDPDFKPDDAVAAAAPPQPPRPQRQPMSQLEADEMYARQLAEQYNAQGAPSGHQYNQREPGRRGPNRQGDDRTYDRMEEDPDRNFFDDDLPEIGRNIQQGFFETQKKFNSWITNFKKKIDGEESEDEDLYSSSQPSSRQNTGATGRQNFGSSQREQMYGIQKQADQRQQRRSTEANRYDADPQVLGDDEFERLELRDDEAPPPQPPRTSSRKAPNPDLFKSGTTSPPQSGPVDEVDAADRSNSNSGAEADKAKKWQPLTSVAPHPEEDNDPFSLGDDDEGGDATKEDRSKSEDLRKEDSERLKEAARKSIQEGGSGAEGGSLEKVPTAAETTGAKNAEAERILSPGE